MDFNINLFMNVLIIGISTGAVIALIALGYPLVYGVVELINFAHGEVFMLGAFFAATVVGLTGVTSKSPGPAIIGTLILGLIGATLFSAALNWGIDRVAYRRLRTAPRLVPLIAAIGFSFIFQQMAIYWKGSVPFKPPAIIPLDFKSYNILKEWFSFDTKIRFRLLDLGVIGITIPLMLAMTYLVYRTRTGKAMRATAQDREAAALMGIDVNRSIAFAFLLGGALAGAAGMVVLYYNDSARFAMGFRYGLYAFTAAVLGGVGNLTGAVLGGFLIGITAAMSDGFLKELIPGWGAQWTPSVIFGVLVLVMIFRPTGILGQSQTEKV